MLVLFQQTDLTKEPRLKHIINMGEKYLHSERKNMAYIWWISSLKKVKKTHQGEEENFERLYTDKL